MKFQTQKSRNQKSFTFIEVLVGIFLILIVFVGILTAYQLALKVVGLSKNKIVATAIASQQIEIIRNLPYESVGVKNNFPDGILEAISQTTRNGIEYTIETRVDYVVDPADGIASPDDDCPNDYKRVEVKASWPGQFSGEVKLSTDIAPKNLAQECATGGGILSVSVSDAYGQMVSSPLIEVKDPVTDQTIKFATPTEGRHYFSLPASTYRVIVSKDGFSTEQTYGREEIYNGKTIATPEKPHPIIQEGKLVEISPSIDKVGTFSVRTLSPGGSAYFSDSFLDNSKISDSSNVTISGGKANLSFVEGQYQNPGYLDSTTINPSSLVAWDTFSFSDLEPAGTQIIYQILYFDGDNWVIIPDIDLPGNSSGFETSPIDLSALNISVYSQLKLRGSLSTVDPNSSPELYNWQVSWQNSLATPIPNVTFSLEGDKIVGTDINEIPINKYSQNHTSGPTGSVDIPGLEWDFYTFSINPASDLDLINTVPSPQPINLIPDNNLSVELYFESENSLLLTIQNTETLEPIFSATVRLSNPGIGYDITQYTNENGQAYFIPLVAATYNLEIQAPGYSDISTTVFITGHTTKTIKLEQIE